MSTIKVNIKDVVTRTLNEERRSHLKKSYSQLNESKGEDLFKKYFIISSNLISEGYTEKEITQYLNEIDNPLNPNNWGMDKEKIAQGMTDSIWSGAKEFVIKWACNALGFNETFSTILAQSLSNKMTPVDLIRPFKDMSSCTASMPKVVDTISEVVIRQAGASITKTDSNNYEWSGVGSTLIGNMFGQAIEQSTFGETLGGMFCKQIHG
jgi:hypothetical protein